MSTCPLGPYFLMIFHDMDYHPHYLDSAVFCPPNTSPRWSRGTNSQLHTKSSHTEKPKAPKNLNPEASCREVLELPHNTFILKYSVTEFLPSPITHHLMSSCAIYYDCCCCYNLHTTQDLGCFLHRSFIINIRAKTSNCYHR